MYHNIHPFKVCGSMAFSIFIELYDDDGHYPTSEHVITPKRSPVSTSRHPHSALPPAPGNHQPTSVYELASSGYFI